ncbi:MAG: MGMT family protein [Candidatus Hydrothermarchaeota archaeon]
MIVWTSINGLFISCKIEGGLLREVRFAQSGKRIGSKLFLELLNNASINWRDFSEKQETVYRELLKVPKGRLTTYKKLADRCEMNPREVGRILGKNPFPVRIPCHRVVMSNGSIGGYHEGIEKKKRLLEFEGLRIKDNRILDFGTVLQNRGSTK